MIASRWTAVASSYARPEVRRAGKVKLAFRVTLLQVQVFMYLFIYHRLASDIRAFAPHRTPCTDSADDRARRLMHHRTPCT